MPALTQDQKLEGVRALLNPRSVAIVGASDRPGNWSMRVFQTLRRFGFPGPIYPVNPRNKTVWDGETCYPSLADLPEAPDHVVVIVPGAAAIDTIAEAGKVKARSATVFSGGFGEGGDPKGRELARAAPAGDRRRRPCGVGPQLPRQSRGAAPVHDHPGRPHRRARARPGRDRRPERRHRDGDPARAARARRQDQLRDHAAATRSASIPRTTSAISPTIRMCG